MVNLNNTNQNINLKTRFSIELRLKRIKIKSAKANLAKCLEILMNKFTLGKADMFKKMKKLIKIIPKKNIVRLPLKVSTIRMNIIENRNR